MQQLFGVEVFGVKNGLLPRVSGAEGFYSKRFLVYKTAGVNDVAIIQEHKAPYWTSLQSHLFFIAFKMCCSCYS